MPEHVRGKPKKNRVHFDTTDQKGKERRAKHMNFIDKDPFLKVVFNRKPSFEVSCFALNWTLHKTHTHTLYFSLFPFLFLPVKTCPSTVH